MLERFLLIVALKFIVCWTIIFFAERQQLKPYYYFHEVVLGCIVVAITPLVGQLALYVYMGYQLRDYPYGMVRAWLWPVECYRSIIYRYTRRYPFRH